MMHEAADDARQALDQRAERNALLAAYWSPGQNRIAYMGVVNLGVPSKESSPFVDAYGFDYPRRLFWSTWFDGSEAAHDVRRSLDREAIAHAQIDLHNVRTLILGSIESEPLAQLSDLDSRFVGHPIRHEVIKLLTPADALPEDPVEGLRAALEDESIKRVLVDETIPAWLSRRAADALRDSR